MKLLTIAGSLLIVLSITQCAPVPNPEPFYLLGGALPTVTLIGGLATQLALLGGAKLGIAAYAASQGGDADQEEEAASAGYPSAHYRRHQV